MFIKKSSDIPSSEITPKTVYLNRRRFIAGAAVAGAAVVAGGGVSGKGATPAGAGADTEHEDRRAAEKFIQHHRKTDTLQGRHELQQLLRILDRQVRAGWIGKKLQNA